MEDNLKSHSLSLKDRNILDMTGVKTIQSFDNQEFLILTSYGTLHIKGKDLAIAKMDTDNEVLQIKGLIEQINYINDRKNDSLNSKERKESFFSKIFK